MWAFAAVKLMLGVPRGDTLDIAGAVPNGLAVMFIFASGFDVRKGCDKGGIPVGDITSGATGVGKGEIDGKGLCDWNCSGSEEFCVGACSEVSSSHTPPLLGVLITFALCDEKVRDCETARVGGKMWVTLSAEIMTIIFHDSSKTRRKF